MPEAALDLIEQFAIDRPEGFSEFGFHSIVQRKSVGVTFLNVFPPLDKVAHPTRFIQHRRATLGW
jgi:hypothetical protein